MEPVILRPGVGDNRPTATLYYGQDTRETLRALPEASVHTVCTSPPYFGLRDYGTGDKQIGLESTPEEFVAALVDVFREVKRVLRPDGTLWVNLGDSYTVGANGAKPKDLMGIPWRVAFALQADGWYLRQDIIWHKPNPMPESVTDRCTKAHEYVFLFAHPDSGGKYCYDAEAVREPVNPVSIERNKYGWSNRQRVHDPREIRGQRHAVPGTMMKEDGRNKRSVWTVSMSIYKGAHFATWPTELVRPMVLAGCPVGGTVLDPFSGSATTGMVALQEGRNYIGTDLNLDYLPLAERRVQEEPAPVNAETQDDGDALDLFSDG
jgi:DNA modification methylase